MARPLRIEYEGAVYHVTARRRGCLVRMPAMRREKILMWMCCLFLKACRQLLQADEPIAEIIAFHAQQAVEKALDCNLMHLLAKYA